MAIGDKAAAKGLIVYPATQSHSNGYSNDNQRGDDIADEIDARVAAVAAEAAARAAADAGKAPTVHTHPVTDVGGGTWTGPVYSPSVASLNSINGNGFGVGGTGKGFDGPGNVFAVAGDFDGSVTVRGHVYVPNRTAVTSGYVSAYINSDGRLGVSPSARKFKQDITPFTLTLEQVRLIQVVIYRLKDAVIEHGAAALWEIGVIAEQLVDAGLSQFVAFDEAGNPYSVHYERLALACIGAIQDLAAQQDDLDARLTALEGKRA